MGYQNYTVMAGNQKVKNLFFHLFYNKIHSSYGVVFTKSNLYCQKNFVNRLFGLTYGIFETTSIYFGWRSLYNKIELLACIQHNNFTYRCVLCSLCINTEYLFTIKRHKDSYTFSIYDQNNVLVCFYRIPKKDNSTKFGFENFIKIKHSKGAPIDQIIFMNKKH